MKDEADNKTLDWVGGEWIKCSDRLPEMYKRVLIKADCYIVAGREPKNKCNEDWGMSGDWIWGIVNDCWVDSHMATHWKPLPEPPK